MLFTGLSREPKPAVGWEMLEDLRITAAGTAAGPAVDLAKLGGLKDIVPTEDVISTKFKPVPTKP